MGDFLLSGGSLQRHHNMFDRAHANQSSASSSPRKVQRSMSSHAGPTPFHRRVSYIPRDAREWRPKFKWHWYDNQGSYNQWFDWLPLWMRVGYWSPVAVLFIVGFYASMYLYKPSPLEFAITTTDDVGFWADCAVFAWGIIVVLKARYDMGAISGKFGVLPKTKFSPRFFRPPISDFR